MRSIFIILCTIFTNQVMAKDYIVVGVSGYGTNNSEKSQPSGAHDLLPTYSYGKIENSYKLFHKSPKKHLREIISEFKCRNKKQHSNLGLIVMANSWGSAKAIKLTKMYKKACSRQADLFVMIDGVKKPILAQGVRPHAKKCINYYQTKGLIRGKAIKGCENHNVTSKACYSSDGGIECHIKTEWYGARLGKSRIKKYIKNN